MLTFFETTPIRVRCLGLQIEVSPRFCFDSEEFLLLYLVISKGAKHDRPMFIDLLHNYMHVYHGGPFVATGTDYDGHHATVQGGQL